ncbi:MAG: endonuclease/exonuclease/phosphatase family protein [Polyangiaceae bacterium]
MHGTIGHLHLGAGLGALRERIDASAIPAPRRGHLRIATWNIREFGRRPRRPESLRYIAEILGQFDLVSIVELRENLAELAVVLGHLGPSWRALFTAPVFDAGGNRERIAYVFDSRRVTHTGLASMAVAPRTKRGTEYLAKICWWRPPFLASFRAGEAELLLLTAHIRWGTTVAERLPEIALLAKWIETELSKDPYAHARDTIVTGDFNVTSVRSSLYDALLGHGLEVPAGLVGVHGSNLAKNKRYDQILRAPGGRSAFTGRGGALDFCTGRGGMRALYPPSVSAREFTYELSDHLPLWSELRLRGSD